MKRWCRLEQWGVKRKANIAAQRVPYDRPGGTAGDLFLTSSSIVGPETHHSHPVLTGNSGAARPIGISLTARVNID